MWKSLTALARSQRARSSLPGSARSTTFSSLRIRNFRLFATGQLFSNTGTWVQRIAQDWLVLSLTGNATDVGITTALQFLPTLLFGLAGGLIADRYPKRRILLATQASLSAIAGILAFLTLTHQVAPWQVYLIAFGLGLVTAVDNPTRQSFANEMAGPEHLCNAISINSSVFQLGGLIGPAISGVLISAVGPGYSFTINALSYFAPLVALAPLLLLTATNSTVQVAAHDTIRGRVMGIYLLVFIGAAAIGGPLLGLIDQHIGPRAGMLTAGVVPAVATTLIAAKLASGRSRQQRRRASDQVMTAGPCRG